MPKMPTHVWTRVVATLKPSTSLISSVVRTRQATASSSRFSRTFRHLSTQAIAPKMVSIKLYKISSFNMNFKILFYAYSPVENTILQAVE